MSDSDSRRPLGVYVHVPFCTVHCPYCDFYTYPANRGRQDDFVAALQVEIRLVSTRLDPSRYRVETIYFGGGTPALLPVTAITAIIDELRQELLVEAEPEVTLEANPREVEPGYLSDLMAAGVNRLSVGVQSLNDGLLSFLGRDHCTADAEQALAAVAPWRNWSADLIFGSARQNDCLLQADLNRLLAFKPPHISLYQLTVEPQTRFGSLAGRGETLLAGEAAQAEQFELVCDRLSGAGFEHYEISNFARPGFRARHNAAYWKRTDYIGLGPSASSLIANRRTRNLKSLPGYINRLRQNHSVVDHIEILLPQEVRNERIWLGLRTSDGIHEELLDDQALRFVPDGIRNGLLVNRDDGIIQLTERGMALADAVAGRFLLTDKL